MNTLTRTKLVRCYTVDKLISNLSDNYISRNLEAIPQAVEARKNFLALSYSQQLIQSFDYDNSNMFKAKVNAINFLDDKETLELYTWIKQVYKQEKENERIQLLLQKYNICL